MIIEGVGKLFYKEINLELKQIQTQEKFRLDEATELLEVCISTACSQFKGLPHTFLF